ncbi:hypothetical protein A2U01_0061262, partial [Trifolium medium]|nr:hypothetical protein [Trifolium medium]
RTPRRSLIPATPNWSKRSTNGNNAQVNNENGIVEPNGTRNTNGQGNGNRGNNGNG